MSLEPVAVVGRACVLPGALTPAALWQQVRAGRDLIGTPPPGRWRLDPSRLLAPSVESTERVRSERGGYVEGFDAVFDPHGFALPAADLAGIDPLFLWLLHVSREALRDAGRAGGPRVGAIFGNLSFPSSSLSRFAERVWLGDALAEAAGVAPTHPLNRFSSGLPAHLVARALGLGGGAFCLDAACASSLYAIALACDRLRDRTADLMLAGAVNCADDLFIHVGFSALQALSPSGRSRPFHREADGLVPAEGAGAVVLRRLADAEADGDRILGVIRAVGLSNDGRVSSLVAPSEEGQVRAMRAAYDAAGLSPADISLLECHATGTAVGDETEVRSLRRVFGEARELPIGSLKSNFGHAIAAAGIAGLIKVLGAIESRERPPTLHAGEPLEALRGAPLRLLREVEPWTCAGPRRAAVSAFGFGGNNAHLIVEEYLGPEPRRALGRGFQPADAGRRGGIAVVGIGAAIGAGTTLADFEAALFAPCDGAKRRGRAVELPVTGIRFPPRDLARALPQQTWILAAAREAMTGLALPREGRAGAFIGMGCDPEVARYGARWRAPEWARSWGVVDETWAARAAEAFAPALEPAGVLGTMPNIPANRLNVQFDLRGPGFTVSAEELSGVRALQIAARALREGDLDLALVGAADFSCEAAHESALRALDDPRPTGDGAVLLVLMRAEDARRDGLSVLALLDAAPEDAVLFGEEEIEERFGRAHAAFGLIRIAAAVLACARGRRVGGAPWAGARAARLELPALGGERAEMTVRAGESDPLAPLAAPRGEEGPMRQYPAHAAAVALPPLPEVRGRPAWPPHSAAPARSTAMPRAPRLPPVLKDDGEPEPVLASTPAPPGAPQRAAPARALVPDGVAAQAFAQHRLLVDVHRRFLEQQTTVHRRFLEMREHATRCLLLPDAHPAAPTTPSPPASPAPVPAADAPRTPRGPRLDRRGLETHASGRISEVFGPLFEKQDGYRRQVRMPEPPLLLADRLLGIDAEPGSLGKGALRTETDVQPDSWYLHEGRMPAGIMIEAGQADLLLISYLGIDFVNRGERVYRLLGCDLTFHGPLPEPGDTLGYDIHVDGHATQGDLRLFSFHYDCRVRGELRLSVRGGQAGFFSDAELANSKGIIWDAAHAPRAAGARVDPPAVSCDRTSFLRADLEAFAAGRLRECFGPGFEAAAAHTRTPRISAGRMLLLDEVQSFEPHGGPWGRGYLRARDRIEPGDWFFQGHFKNDPCMPGTLMFEGCLQAMAVYLSALGHTLDRDGWRFEPVPGETYPLRCRGQVTPQSRELVYEVFVEEVEAGPLPTLRADLLCTVDGLKVFHCRRMGLRLVPGWPLDARAEDASPREERRVAAVNGFRFGAASLLACAWGRPSAAFGPTYRLFDGPRRLPRLPGPPYHFMSRVVRVEGEMGAMRVGSSVEVEYDVPPDAWYFAAGGGRTMPFCVLLEVALQPCGWLALYAGSALESDRDLSFRNLDGTGTLLTEVVPGAGTIRTRVTLGSVSRSGGMIIEAFDVECLVGEQPIFRMKTVFGFFPKEALEAQKGLPAAPDELEALAAPDGEVVDLRGYDGRVSPGGRLVAAPQLLMIDRVTRVWPKGGPAGIGRLRAESDVDPDAWFFKSHFFQDPVQPGSLGLEAMLQLLKYAMLRLGPEHVAPVRGRFEPLALGEPLTWKYRGQVLLKNRRVHTLLDLVRLEEDGRGLLAVADASLWVDGMRIYEARGLALRLVRDEEEEELLDPDAHPWVRDHCPTWTVPALSLMAMVDRCAGAALRRAPGRRVVAVEEAMVRRWLPVPGPVRLKTEVKELDDGRFETSLLAWRNASHSSLSRFEPVADARILLAEEWPAAAEKAWESPADARPVPDPYESGSLFHGPSYRLVRSLRIGATGSTAILDAAGGGPPRGLLHEALLDALTHGIPHDNLALWSADIPPGCVAYPHRIVSLRFFGALPATGTVRCETRFLGFDGEPRLPRFGVQAIVEGKVAAALELVEALLPKGPLGSLAPAERRAFLHDRASVPGARLSREEGDATRLAEADVRASDWLPGTVASAYAAHAEDLLAEIAVKEHVARRARVHPSAVHFSPADNAARSEAEPLTLRALAIERGANDVLVRDAAAARLDLAPVRAFWDRWFGIGRWPVEDLFYGLAERFVQNVRLEDPAAFAAVRGRGLLFLGNHQVGVESLLFSIIASGLTGVRTVTLAKAEHRTSWLGLLISHAFSYPGVADPGVITFFDRAARDELPRVVANLAEDIRSRSASVMVHVEGTRALSCRAPVLKMSGAFLDMAIATGTPVVPVRFVGGLPVETLPARLEFPVGMGRQEVRIGRPISPAELSALGYKERKELVIGAINALGSPNAEETPSEGDPEFAAAAAAWSSSSGASAENAVLYETLRRLPSPCEETRRLLASGRDVPLAGNDDAKELWLRELAVRLGIGC